MRRVIQASVLAAASFAATAQATAIYEWREVNPSATLPRTFGTFEITDELQASGRARFSVDSRGAGGVPNSPLVSFNFLSASVQHRGLGAGAGNAGLVNFDLDLSGRFASGSIFVESSFESVRMASNPGGLFTVNDYRTENSNSTCRPDGTSRQPICFGATGRWELTSSAGGGQGSGGSGQVPLPGTLPLMALASFGAAVGLSRRKAA